MLDNINEVLYQQLLKMEEDNKKENHIKLVEKNIFMNFSKDQALSYIFWYRDTQTLFVNSKGEEEEEYIELPNMDLRGYDLSKTLLKKELIGSTKDVIGVKMKRFIPITYFFDGEEVLSKLNFNGTNAEINLSNLIPTRVEENDIRIQRFVIDFSNCDFRNCKLYGILPDEYQPDEKGTEKFRVRWKIIGKEKLDATYLERRKKHHLEKDSKKIVDRVYEKLKKYENINSIRGLSGCLDLTDYDLSDLEPDKIKKIISYAFYKKNIIVNCKYTGIRDEILGFENFNGLNRIQKREIIEEKIKDKDFNFIQKYFPCLDKDCKLKVMRTLTIFDSKENNFENNSNLEGNEDYYFAERIVKQEELEQIYNIFDLYLQDLKEEEQYQIFVDTICNHNFNILKRYIDVFKQSVQDGKYRKSHKYTEKSMMGLIYNLDSYRRNILFTIEEREKISEIINNIRFNGIDIFTQIDLMNRAIDEKRFDYVEQNLKFVLPKISVPNSEKYRYPIIEILKKLIDIKKNKNITIKESRAISKIMQEHFYMVSNNLDGKTLILEDAADSGDIQFLASKIGSLKSDYLVYLKVENINYERTKRDLISRLLINLPDVTFSGNDLIHNKYKFNYQDQYTLEEVYKELVERKKRICSFYCSELKISNNIEYVNNLIKQVPNILYDIREKDYYKRDDKELIKRKQLFDRFGMSEEIFKIKKDDKYLALKINLFRKEFSVLQKRIEFFKEYGKRLNIDINSSETIWKLAYSDEQFEKEFLCKIFPNQVLNLKNSGNDVGIRELIILEENYQTLSSSYDRN